ncbi:hypothetical protein BDR26DRAFT_856769, partial [Obelidium mucronatum]
MLLACSHCVALGGFDIGRDIYKTMLDNQRAKLSDVMIPDIATYTAAFRLYAQAQADPMPILEVDLMASKLDVDVPLVTTLLHYLAAGPGKDDNTFRIIASAAFNLPLIGAPHHKFKKDTKFVAFLKSQAPNLRLSTKALDVILRFLNHSRDPNGINIIKYLQDKNELDGLLDPGIARLCVYMFCMVKNMDQTAIQFIESLPRRIFDGDKKAGGLGSKSEFLSHVAWKGVSRKSTPDEEKQRLVDIVVKICSQDFKEAAVSGSFRQNIEDNMVTYSHTITNCLNVLLVASTMHSKSNTEKYGRDYGIFAARIASFYCVPALKALSNPNIYGEGRKFIWGYEAILTVSSKCFERGINAMSSSEIRRQLRRRNEREDGEEKDGSQ